MPQIKKTLWMIYHRRPDGTHCLLKNQGEAFGFTYAPVLLTTLLKEQVPELNIEVIQEDVMIDTRFGLTLDPEEFHIPSMREIANSKAKV